MLKSEPLDPEIRELVEDRRGNLTDAHVTDYDHIDSDTGRKIKEEKISGPQGTEQTFECDHTALFIGAPSVTSDLELLRMEAELSDDGTDLDNPHIPSSSDILEAATERLENEGLTPAWGQ